MRKTRKERNWATGELTPVSETKATLLVFSNQLSIDDLLKITVIVTETLKKSYKVEIEEDELRSRRSKDGKSITQETQFVISLNS